MDYNARFYDPTIGRFIQPDTLAAGTGNSQGLNRYAYTNNNPVKYNDPTGHCIDNANGTCYRNPVTQEYYTNITTPMTILIKQLADVATGGNVSASEYKTVKTNITIAIGYLNKDAEWYQHTYGYSWTKERMAYFFATIQGESSWGLQMRQNVPNPADGNYYGRGFVQVTGGSYSTLSQNIWGDDRLVQDPDTMATNPSISMRVAIRAMYSGDINSNGLNLSTIGKSGNLYQDYLNARNIVDPGDNVLRVSIADFAMNNYLPLLNSVSPGLLPIKSEQ